MELKGSKSARRAGGNLYYQRKIHSGWNRQRLRLQLESLEPRCMLAADLDPAWAVFQTPSDTKVLSESARMIVQLTHESTNELVSVDDVRDFFHAMHGAELLYGLGKSGQFAISLEHETVGACLAGSASFEWMQRDTSVDGFATPDDPSFDSQHGLSNSAQNGGTVGADIDATLAWDITTGSLANVAAVIDTGIDYTHPDLFGNIWLNQGEVPATLRASLTDTDTDGLITFRDLNQAANAAFVSDLNGNSYIDAGDLLEDPRWENGIDDDGNSFVDDLIGWDFRNNDNDPLDDHGHGTHVSGILGASGDNGLGVAGVNWDVQLMPLKFLGESNSGSTIDASRAIRYATMMREEFGVNIKASNNSWGSREKPSQVLRDAISEHGDAEILFVAGAGNGTLFRSGIDLDSDSGGFFPASYDLDGIISVASSDTADKLAIDSNFGKVAVDLSAPGVGILSTKLGGGYQFRNGTSMAAPHVTGAALLVWANLPDATLAEVRNAILGSTDAVPSSSGKLVTGGRVSADGALQIDTFAPRASLTPIATITSDGGTSQPITISVRDNVLVDIGTIDDADLRVVRRDAPDIPLAIKLDFKSSLFPKQSLDARYIATAPGGTWDRDDNGTYDIVLVAGQISDNIGISNFQIPLGSFEVRIAFAGDIPITTFADGADSNVGDGISRDASGNSTLRSAIQTANASPGENTLILEPGTYTLGLAGANEDAAVSGDLDITDTLTIIGNGSIIDAASLDRVFDVKSGATLNLRGITLTGGNAAGDGGAIRNLGGNITIANATLHDNQATGSGGAIQSGSGSVTLVNTTISTNKASVGAGLKLDSPTVGDLLNATVTNNTATSTAGGIQGNSTVTLRNTIIAGNFATTSPDTAGSFISGGHNLIGMVGSATGLTNGSNGNLVGTFSSPIDAKLGPLKDNTGSLLTHVPASESPAVDAGDNVDTPPTDARGIERILDANRDRNAVIDIGAVEKFFGSIEGVAFIDRDGDGERHIAVDVPFTGIEEMTAVGDTLYFTFDDGKHGRELWKINKFGARLVRDIAPGSVDSSPSSLVDVNGTLYFAADNGFLGRELWKSDGTKDGTVLVRDINGSASSSNPNHLAKVGTTIYFAADDGINGVELWKSDGTELGTVLVRNIAPGPTSSFPENLDNINGTLIFSADDGSSGRELWKSGGASVTTNLIADINSGGSSDPNEIIAIDSTLFFTAVSSSGRELYRSVAPFDAVTLVTSTTLSNPANARELSNVNGILVFAADGDNGNELFKSQSPFTSVVEIADINSGTSSSSPSNLISVGETIYFYAQDGIHGIELWSATGSLESARLVADINPGAAGSSLSSAVAFNNALFFIAVDATGIPSLWKTDPIGQAISLVKRFPNVAGNQMIDEILIANGHIYFLASDNTLAPVLWQSSGTSLETRPFVDRSEPGKAGQILFIDSNDNSLLDPFESSVVSRRDDPSTLNIDESGQYRLEGLLPGLTTVRELSDDSQIRTRPDPMVTVQEFDLDSLRKENGGDGSDGVVIKRSDINMFSSSLGVETKALGDINGDGIADFASYILGDNGGTADRDDTVIILGRSTGFLTEFQLADVRLGFRLNDTSIEVIEAVGDVNGDGFDDFGVRRNSSGGGEIVVVFGRSEFPSNSVELDDLLTANGQPGAAIFPSDTSSLLSLVGGGGDLNGDGIDDLIFTLINEGLAEVTIVYGSTAIASNTPAPLQLSSGDGSQGRRITLSRITSIGASQVSTGDVNGDGIDDLAILGASVVVFGSRVASAAALQASGLYSFNGGDGTHGFVLPPGSDRIDLSGDFNGDGINDLVTGDGNPGSALPGYVLFGSDQGFPAEPSAADVTDSGEKRGVSIDNGFVFEAFFAGDFNSDGFSDIVFYEEGRAYILYGTSTPASSLITPAKLSLDTLERGRIGAVFLGDIVRDNGRFAVKAVGDVTGDGIADLMIGTASSDGRDGASFLVFGKAKEVSIPVRGVWSVDLQPGTEATGNDFGHLPASATIRGRVFRDLNNNAARDAGEVGVMNVVVFIDQNNNGVLDEGELNTTTDLEGLYTFQNLEALETYVVRQVLSSNVQQLLPQIAEGGAYEISLQPGEVFENADFGNRDLVNGVGAGLIRGTLFADGNENGIQDAGEAGIASRFVFVDLNANSIRDASEPTAVTDASGQYVLAGLAENVYSVRLDATNELLSTPRRSQFTASVLSPGDAPQAVESADFNNDSKLDLAVANFETNTVSILMNNGSGGFTKSGDVAVGFQPTSLALADLDGNGSVDIVVGHQSSNFVGVLRNRGDGTFGEVEKLTAGDGPRGVAVADFDGTGGPDIVVANQFSDSVSVFINNGGTFAPPVHIPVGDAPTSVSIGNLDDNNGPDIVTTNSGDRSISVILNTGGNSFFTPLKHTVGELPFDSDLADLDGDGVLDVAVVNVLSDTASVLFGLGNGGFGDSISLPAGSGPTSVTAIDLEQDGRLDLLVTNGSPLNLAVLRNLGNRVFESPDNFGVGEIESTLAWAATANDFNGDGVIDLAVANGDADSVSILSNQLTNGSYRVRIVGDETITGVNFGIASGDAPPETSIVLSGAGTTLGIASIADAQLAVLESVDIRGSGNNALVLNAEKIRSLVPNQTLAIIADKGDSITFGDGWIYSGSDVTGGKRHRIFTNGNATVRVVGPLDWTNPLIVGDVNGSGDVTAGDALDILFSLNQPQLFNSQGVLVDAATVTPSNFRFYDTNEDGTSTAADALFVINVLFLQSLGGSGEGESTPVPSALIATREDELGDVKESLVSPGLYTDKASKDLPLGSTFIPAESGTTTAAKNPDETQPVPSESHGDLDASFASVWDWIKQTDLD